VLPTDPSTALAWIEAAGAPEDAAAVLAEARLRTGAVADAGALADQVLAAESRYVLDGYIGASLQSAQHCGAMARHKSTNKRKPGFQLWSGFA
jgi:hypothetical protein